MKVITAQKDDYQPWLDLAREVEYLFGPMADEDSFKTALSETIASGSAYCIRNTDAVEGGSFSLIGGVVISAADNEVVWLAVTGESRNQGAGRALLTRALAELNPDQPIKVVTFSDGAEAGAGARRLYQEFGFQDREKRGFNPAGWPIVLMERV